LNEVNEEVKIAHKSFRAKACLTGSRFSMKFKDSKIEYLKDCREEKDFREIPRSKRTTRTVIQKIKNFCMISIMCQIKRRKTILRINQKFFFETEKSGQEYEIRNEDFNNDDTQIDCYAPGLSTGTLHLAISSSLSIKQACLTVLITLQSIESFDSLIMLKLSASELKNEQEISDQNFIERFTKRFIS
jgi:hypothetical protein